MSTTTKSVPYTPAEARALLDFHRTFAVRPVAATCRYCAEPIDLFTDSAFYCCRECRDCAYLEMGGFDGERG